jgi:hypothetical protein
MANIFDVPYFEFPYTYRFPGQSTNEKILYVTRENKVMLLVRLLSVVMTALVIMILAFILGSFASSLLGRGIAGFIQVLGFVVAVFFGVIGWWWVATLWKKSLAIVTTQRLTKIIYTTPFNRHTLSLPLEMIVDTGSYTKGLLQAIFKLATFTARSSAASSGVSTDDGDRVNKKYFYIENIAMAEDLQHYVNKLLQAFRYQRDKIESFRPFIPHLKGQKREAFMKQHPEYWS